jgi:hypothetical protein
MDDFIQPQCATCQHCGGVLKIIDRYDSVDDLYVVCATCGTSDMLDVTELDDEYEAVDDPRDDDDVDTDEDDDASDDVLDDF